MWNRSAVIEFQLFVKSLRRLTPNSQKPLKPLSQTRITKAAADAARSDTRLEVYVLLAISEPTTRLTRRSLLLSASSAAALLAMPGSRFHAGALAAQTPTAASAVFFDPAVVHDITAMFDQAEYDAVIAAYAESGEKEWLSATLTIDGQTFEQVGLRLKGNSSLMALREDLDQPDGNPENVQPATDVVTADGTPIVGDPENRTMVMGGPGGMISADEPEGLPWLVRLDRNIEGQNLNGLYEFVIRSNHSETALNEALSLDLLAEAGLASQAAAYIRFTANDNDPRLRIAIENPDDVWLAAHFSEDGTLFKSEAEGNWSYRDENWESYVESFDLEAGGGDDDAANYAPLISFIDFVNNSDDASFIAELPSRLVTDQFADYLAMMDLLQNDDDISGPGNNSYLYYDPATSMFTIVPWDMNLSFAAAMRRDGGPAFADGPDGEGDMGPGSGMFVIVNGTPVAGEDMPDRPNGDEPIGPREGGPGGMGGIGGINNPLVKRWEADADFSALQSASHERLRAELIESGVASEILARWVAVLETHATDLVDRSTIESESQSLQEQIDAA
jgi:spore coat protein CotH